MTQLFAPGDLIIENSDISGVIFRLTLAVQPTCYILACSSHVSIIHTSGLPRVGNGQRVSAE